MPDKGMHGSTHFLQNNSPDFAPTSNGRFLVRHWVLSLNYQLGSEHDIIHVQPIKLKLHVTNYHKRRLSLR